MKKSIFEVPFLSAIGMIVTYKCPIACAHCLLKCSPFRKEEISLRNARDWISQVALYRDGYIKMISLTGGEPFFDMDRLKKISSHAKNEGLVVTAVTNAFWADTERNAEKTLANLDSLDALAISTDKHHQVRIPYRNIENAITAVQSAGLPCIINICTEDTADPFYLALLEKIKERVHPDCIRTVTTFPFGRAENIKRGYQLTPDPPKFACGSCDAPVIFPNGRITACLGPVVDIPGNHPLVLGNLNDQPLSDILAAADRKAVMHALRLWGPKKLIASVERAGLAKHLPEGYIRDNICSICHHLMNTPELREFLTVLETDPEFIQLVTYGRMYFLDEPDNGMRREIVCNSCGKLS